MITCTPKATDGIEPPNRKVQWSEATKTKLQNVAEQRSLAMKSLSEMYAPVDPIKARAREASIRAQEYWEGLVMEAGQMAYLSPNKTANTANFIADMLGQKIGQARDVREPMLNIKRLVEGNMREVGIYKMLTEQIKFADTVKALGVDFSPSDFTRLVEEGLTPQRMAVYGNSPEVHAELTTRFTKFKADMAAKGIDAPQLQVLLDRASDIAALWDEVRAVTLATGQDVGDLFNIGYMPRAFTPEALTALRNAGAIKAPTAEAAQALLAKSRSTWRYLVSDHATAAKLLDIDPPKLLDLIANPSDFAQYLSLRTTDDQLDLLVDSGVLSKVPATSSEVAEFLTRKYKVPLTNADMWIHDPVAASNHMIDRLKAGAQQSALIKQLQTEGVRQGWAVTKEMFDASPEMYGKFTLANQLEHVKLAAGGTYLHPDVAFHLNGILKLAADPAELSNAARFFKWWKSSFAKQALGNPITATAYLSKQILSNMSSVMGRGGGVIDFATSMFDIINVTQHGLDVLDNVKPFRMLNGSPVTHREFVAKTLRIFSHNLLPGIDVTGTGSKVFDWKQLSPAYNRAQFERIRAAGANGVQGYLKEAAKVAGEKADAVFLPTLRMASIIDMAGQLAVARAKTTLGYGGVKKLAKDVDQTLLGWGNTRLDNWDEVVVEVKRAFPMFDDPGRVVEAVSYISPFQTWAMHNVPLQVADMVRQPSRWMNYSRMNALWNDNMTADDPLLEGEMQKWERDKYGIVLRHDPATKKTVMLFNQDYDPRWGALSWLAKLADGKEMSDIRDDIRGRSSTKAANALIAGTYFSGVYKAFTGIDPQTGLLKGESPITFEQFGGINMPPFMAAILSISPVLQSLDRLPFISGTKQVTNPRTDEVLQEATNGWLGNQGKLTPKQLESTEAALQVLGGSVRVIDRMSNMNFTWRDTTATIQELRNTQSKEQKALQAAVLSGAVKVDSDTYRKRTAAIDTMTRTILQLNTDLGRIEQWGVSNGVPSQEVMQKLRDAKLSAADLPMPGSEFLREQLDLNLKLTNTR